MLKTIGTGSDGEARDGGRDGMRDGVQGGARAADCLFYVVGTQKAGTTWLHDYFRRHPEAHCSPIKEGDFWNAVRPPFKRGQRFNVRTRLERARARHDMLSDLGLGATGPGRRTRRRRDLLERHHRCFAGPFGDVEAYLDYLGHGCAPGVRAIGEVSPQYMHLEAATYAEMAALHPNARFVLVMREPVSRIWSMMGHIHRKARRAEHRDPEALKALCREYLEADDDARLVRYTTYPATIRRLEAAVPRERLLYLFYETLFEQETIDRLNAFLGIGAFRPDLAKRVHGGGGVEGGPGEALAGAIYRRYAHVYDFILERFGDATPEAWRARMASMSPTEV